MTNAIGRGQTPRRSQAEDAGEGYWNVEGKEHIGDFRSAERITLDWLLWMATAHFFPVSVF